MASNDRDLGMHRRIRRRDFLNGVAIATGTFLSSAALRRAFADSLEPEAMADYYPPVLTGMRGDHDDIYKTPHALRDRTFGRPPEPRKPRVRVMIWCCRRQYQRSGCARFYRQATGHTRAS